VKTRANKTFDSWLVGKNVKSTKSASLIYVLVSFKDDQPEFLVVPSRIVANHVRPKGTFLFFHPSEVTEAKRGWRIFGPGSRLMLPLQNVIKPMEADATQQVG
jgi:hypothetical protein